MTLRARILMLVLALALALGGGMGPVLRVQMAGAWVLELCTGHGTTATVTLDAQGNPVETGHLCADCCLGPILAVETQPVLPPRAARWQRQAAPAVPAPPLVARLMPEARGPPAA